MQNPEPYAGNAIYWVEVDRIKPNPFQPRKVFEEAALSSLAESIRQYGVLQPLVVTRRETIDPESGIRVVYELIAGERRLRASKLAGISQVPVIIRTTEDSDRVKLEIAIIENLQREDLNAVDRALAFNRLYTEFALKHIDIGKRVGKSREYVSNTLRILQLPKEMQDALQAAQISEGHTRPLLMLIDKPEEQKTLFTEIVTRKLTVRDAEQLARRVAIDKVRKTDLTPELLLLERELTEALGTRVRIEKGEQGGKLHIDFFNAEDLAAIRSLINRKYAAGPEVTPAPLSAPAVEGAGLIELAHDARPTETPAPSVAQAPTPDEPEEDLYSISNFSV